MKLLIIFLQLVNNKFVSRNRILSNNMYNILMDERLVDSFLFRMQGGLMENVVPLFLLRVKIDG